MSYLDKYRLLKGSKKWLCPNPGCGKKTFVPYVDVETGVPVNEYIYGRCDRENHCGYHVLPPILKTAGERSQHVNILYPDYDKLNLQRKPTPLHRYLEGKGIPMDFLYDQGVLEDRGMTVYVFRDGAGRVTNAKWFKYKEDGHRDKDFTSFSLKQPEQRNEYVEDKYTIGLFGEHELDPEKKRIVCVVESEKSKVIAKFHYPQYDWQACGSANGLSDGSEGSANKIGKLKDRTVYWVGDADQASRGKMVQDERSGKEVWQWCSSIRNGIKYIDDFHVVDLWPDRNDGHDIGDELLEGKKPEIKPTWSKIQTNPLFQSYVPPDLKQMLKEFREGKAIGESAHVEQISNLFSWKPGFLNCWTGWPNDGKSTFFLFMALVKSKHDGTKWCIWPPEMINSYRDGAQIKISASDIYDELAYMLTGKSPYLHFEKKYGIKQIGEDEYLDAIAWVRQHFYIIYPKDRKYKDLANNFLFFHEYFGCNGFLADPFKSFKHEESGRTDFYMDDLFGEYKELAVKTNGFMNFIAHPKSQKETLNKDGSFKVCTQFMLAGGASWDNSMDGIYSTYRANRHKNPTDPVVHFYNLKQRKQQLVGRVGVYEHIEFDWNINRYYFDGVCPIDGSFKNPVQSQMEFSKPWQKKVAKPEAKEKQVEWFEPDKDEVPF